METEIGGLLTLDEMSLLKTVLANPESVLLARNLKSYKMKKMNKKGLKRFIWCGGGSTLVDEDVMSFGARSVEIIARTFLKQNRLI